MCCVVTQRATMRRCASEAWKSVRCVVHVVWWSAVCVSVKAREPFETTSHWNIRCSQATLYDGHVCGRIVLAHKCVDGCLWTCGAS